MSLIIIGEVATKVMVGYIAGAYRFALVQYSLYAQSQAHGYFDINLNVVWETFEEWLTTQAIAIGKSYLYRYP